MPVAASTSFSVTKAQAEPVGLPRPALPWAVSSTVAVAAGKASASAAARISVCIVVLPGYGLTRSGSSERSVSVGIGLEPFARGRGDTTLHGELSCKLLLHCIGGGRDRDNVVV